MPSPIGHALAGAALAWSLDRRSRPAVRIVNRAPSARPGDGACSRSPWVTWVCVALAVAPDLDLLAPYTHRTVTHSLFAVAVVLIVAIAVTGKVTSRIVPIVVACTSAYASHLLLDWLAVDDSLPRGVQLLWPFGDRWFISGWDLFRGTARRDLFTVQSLTTNLLAMAQEVATLGPLALLAYVRHRTPPRGTQVEALPPAPLRR
jgi:membrane-bound metal-dependent hydrolase YbcI (DUF457 family)